MKNLKYFSLEVAFILGVLLRESNGGTLSFCDGEQFVNKTREHCTAGVSFGENKPDCICVSGIYRFLADSCETADGFADNVCTKITDDNGMGTSIVGVKFTRDPVNWSQTGIVCERRGFGTETWDFITDKHSRGSLTKSVNIYGLNGNAFITKGRNGKQAFCLEPADAPENEKICRYLKSENTNVWNDPEIEVFVRPKCDGTPITPHKCFGVLTAHDSECQLSCSEREPESMPMGRALHAHGAMANLKTDPQAIASSKHTPHDPNDSTHIVEYWKHDNKFLNRKMMIYNIISQLDTGDINRSGNGSWGEPKRTFEVFDMMKNITRSYCPDEYVSREWIDLVVELFYILHKGNIFRYDENLSVFEYEWIKDILSKCYARVNDVSDPTKLQTVQLSSEPSADDPVDDVCTAGGGKATGYCNGTTEPMGNSTAPGQCNFKPINVQSHRANDSYHFVPDVAWNIVDIIQVICFQEFNESYRMFHVLEQAAEKLFTLQIRNLWYEFN
ncbi:unnamed protein product [Orchesella dallaii]|uniref:Uncharacterized protein n=1 Tax=Orchesella dallaii TaxID=48710 RepID=A0ABP1SA82_9HEXA